MRHIDTLVKKQDAGETLDTQQLKSIASLGDILADMESYLASNKGSTEDDSDDDKY